MLNRTDQQLTINFLRQILEVADDFNYLGTIVNIDGQIDQEIMNIIRKANGVFFQISLALTGTEDMNKETKLHLFR